MENHGNTRSTACCKGPAQVTRHTFTFIFTLELLLRSFAGRTKFFFHSEDWMWNWLDVFIVWPGP